MKRRIIIEVNDGISDLEALLVLYNAITYRHIRPLKKLSIDCFKINYLVTQRPKYKLKSDSYIVRKGDVGNG